MTVVFLGKGRFEIKQGNCNFEWAIVGPVVVIRSGMLGSGCGLVWLVSKAEKKVVEGWSGFGDSID